MNSPSPQRSTLFPYTTLFRSCNPAPSPRTARRANLRPVARPWPASGRERPSPVAPPPCCLDSRERRPPALLLQARRSEEHTSELQSRGHLVCRLLLEKKSSTP